MNRFRPIPTLRLMTLAVILFGILPQLACRGQHPAPPARHAAQAFTQRSAAPTSGTPEPNPAAPIICIDPGHPSEVNNGLTVQNGATETHIDWVVAEKLKAILTRQGYKVIMTKSSEKELVKNKERALIANRARATLMVRLHCDSSSDKGYALYYPDRQGTTQGKTGPTADIMKRSKAVAQALDSSMAKALDGTLKNGGVRGDSKTAVGGKQGALTGSIFSEVPVVTIEMVVLSNKGDAEFIKTEEGQQQMAEAIADGISHFAPIPAPIVSRR